MRCGAVQVGTGLVEIVLDAPHQREEGVPANNVRAKVAAPKATF